jgi:hypothetical protein
MTVFLVLCCRNPNNLCSYYLKVDILIVTVLDKEMSRFIVRDIIEDKAEFGRTIQ